MLGKRVVHVETGEIKTIAEYSPSGNVTFDDGTDGDIHYSQNPFKQDGKDWQYIDREESFNQEHIKLLRNGKAAIRFYDYNDMSDSDFSTHVYMILSEVGVTDFATGYRWKYIYLDETGEVQTEDSSSDIPESCNKRIEYYDFYQTVNDANINNYSIY
jgi:hypothetical protein